MMKSALVLAASLMIGLTGCKKADEAVPLDSPTNIVNSTLGQATIKGKAFIDTDITPRGNEDAEDRNTTPAAGLQILVSANYSINGRTETINQFVTVGSDGTFSFMVAAEDAGTTVRLEFLKLEGEQTREVVIDGDDEDITEAGFYEFSATSVSVRPGKTEILANRFFTGFTSTANPSFF